MSRAAKRESTMRLMSLAGVAALAALAAGAPVPSAAAAERVRVVLDTDANNELDDQHAIAYLLFGGDAFDVEGITVNRTKNGGDVHEHFAEAARVVELCGLRDRVPLLRGADGAFEEIRGQLSRDDFDGAEAVEFLLERARAKDARPLVILAVGKLTNVALALARDQGLASRVRVVWLGSNYPEPGEYNQENDEASVNFVLDSGVPFEVALVRYGQPSGTDAVRASLEEIRRTLPGKGPRVSPPVPGRHGGSFERFGDYGVSLFENIDLYGDPPSRALFDMAAVAVVKNPAWATPVTRPAPILREGQWVDRPDNPRRIVLWEDFDREAIMADFYATLASPRPARPGDALPARRWEQVELTLVAARERANPYAEVDVHVELEGPQGATLVRPAFWDGGRTFRARFAAPATGRWTWRSVSSDPGDAGLHGRRGTIEVAPYEGDHPLVRHGLLRMSPGRRSVVHHDGAPFLVVADTPWALPFRGTVETVTEYARDRQAKGFNAALLMSVQPDRDARGPRNRHETGASDVAFEDLSEGRLLRLRPGYFQTLDRLLGSLHAHGIVPVFNPVFQGFGWKGQRTLGAAADPGEYARYTRYLVARYGARPALWLVSADGTGKEPVTEPAGLEVERWDAYGQPVGIHYSPFDDRKADWTDDPRFGLHRNRSYQDADWLDFQWCQTGHGGEHLPHKVRLMHDDRPVKAVANGEPTYEGIRDPGNAAGWWQGHEAWGNLTSGGTMGVVYGAGGLWQWKLFPDEPGWPAWADGPGRSWREAMRQPGSAHAGAVGRALAGYDTTDMTLLPDVSPHAVGRPGEIYVVYLPEGGAVTLAGLSGELPVRWFDPREGRFAGEGRVSPEAPTLAAPSSSPWVLLAGRTM
jgi:hypothetical protein